MKIYQYPIILAIAALFLSVNAFAQLSAVPANGKELAQFKTTKTCFVQTGNKGFDDNMKIALERSWKVTPYEIIAMEELGTKIKDKTLSFLFPVLIGEPSRGYHYLALINGGKKRLELYAYDDMIAYAPINHWMDENELTDCGWRVENMIQSMQKAIEFVEKEELTQYAFGLVKSLRTIYKKRSKEISKRTLLVSETIVGKNVSKEDFEKIYPFKMEICPREKIEKAIAEKSKEYFYLQPGITMNKNIFVFDPSNGDVVYFDFDLQGMNFTKGNLEDLVDAIKGKK